MTSASTRNARSVINDEDLPFEEFCQACPRFLLALEEADWPQDRLRMMALFWRNLQVHKLRSARDPLAQKTLLVYQAKQRRHWHVVAKSSAGPYDISVVNEKVMEETRARVYWDDRIKKDNARDFKVSIHWDPFKIFHSLIIIHSFPALRCSINDTHCHTLHATYSMPHALCHTLHATCHMPHLAP